MSELQTVVARVVEAGLVDDASPALVVYELDVLRSRLAALATALPSAVHTAAVKACPLRAALEVVLGAGFGLEVASEGELAIAASLGCRGERVVFDSPAKTRREIALALARGHRLNVDNLDELVRVAEVAPASGVGIRVNPEVSGATIGHTFTGGHGAKFGVSIERRTEILDAFSRHAWLDALHVHVGSQGVPLATTVEGIARVCDLARELEARGRAPRVLDIGGGLAVRYKDGDVAPSFAEYAEALRARVPRLFEGPWQVMTEMGRAIFAPCAFALSRVEYVRPANVAVLHLGADMFVRAAYRPESWWHDVVVFDAAGRPKDGSRSPWSLAGPLCFSGDFVARERPLPSIEPGDLVAIRDAGAYTLAMWSRYNSRPMPAVHGWDARGLSLLKPRESLDEIVRFWGAEVEKL